MRKSVFPEKVHQSIYIFALIVLVIGMPVSKFMMSISQIILLCNWLLEGNLKSKFKTFWANKPAVVLSSLLILHFIGLIYTNDIKEGLRDTQIKVPLLILPLILATSRPLTKTITDIILKFFVASIVFGTMVSTSILTGIYHHPIVETRGISIFISHIRFSLLICVAIFVVGYFISQSKKVLVKLLLLALIFWFIAFLVLMESLTGLAILAFTSIVILLYYVFKSKNKLIKFSLLLFICGLITSLVGTVLNISHKVNKKAEDIDFSKLETKTPHGNTYQHGEDSKITENGHYIWIYFCPEEMKEAWNKRSRVAYDSVDLKGNPLVYTLSRFLSSKGLRKDGDAVNSLSDGEIKSIERGISNVDLQGVSNLKGRIYETLWEIDLYNKTGDANGHSLTQRFEYWKVAMNIIKDNFLVGVGTGDVQQAFDEEYVKTNSKLDKRWRLHSHNQYLSIAVAFGIIGLLWFLLTLIYPVIKLKGSLDYLYFSFFIIAIISFFTEDTLETQAGVTFYAFLNSFFLFVRKNQEE